MTTADNLDRAVRHTKTELNKFEKKLDNLVLLAEKSRKNSKSSNATILAAELKEA